MPEEDFIGYQVVNYYVSNYGICNGIQFTYYIGAAGMDVVWIWPNGKLTIG